jgi:selenocysteine-specific elongation factor
LAASNSIVALDSESISRTSILYSAHGWSTLGNKLNQILFAYHKDYPLRIGIQREELRSRLGLSQNMFSLVISRITGEGKVVAESNQIRLLNHVIGLTNDQENTISSYLEILRSDPYSPPTDYTIDEDLLNVLIDQGQVVRINETVIYAAEAYKTMVDTIISTITENGSIDAGQLRDKFGTSRKYALSMLEHLDQQRVTRRTGNERILRSESR